MYVYMSITEQAATYDFTFIEGGEFVIPNPLGTVESSHWGWKSEKSDSVEICVADGFQHDKPDTRRNFSLDENGSLRKQNATRDDEGIYTCQHESSNKTYRVRVITEKGQCQKRLITL